MSQYAEENLRNGEKVVLEGRIHWLLIIGSIYNLKMIRSIIDFLTTKLVLTNMCIKGKHGLLNTEAMDSPLNKISDVKISSDIFGKLFNYATIEIFTVSGRYCFRGIKDAKKFKQAVMNEIEKFDESRIQKQAEKLANIIK